MREISGSRILIGIPGHPQTDWIRMTQLDSAFRVGIEVTPLRAKITSEHYHADMKKENPEWNFCPTCNASLNETLSPQIFSLLLMHPENRYVVSISLSPEDGTGMLTPFSFDGTRKFPVWAEASQLGSSGLARERLYEETVIQHVVPAFRNGFRLVKFTGAEEEFAEYSRVFMKYAQKDIAQGSNAFSKTGKLSFENRSLEEQALAFVKVNSNDGSLSAPSSAKDEFVVPIASPLLLSEDSPVDLASSGVVGFDRIIGGGFPRGRAFLLSGGSGLGKTIFGVQFLLEGVKRNEPGILALSDEDPGELLEQLENLGISLIAAIENRDLHLIVKDPRREYRTNKIKVQNVKTDADFLSTINRLARITRAKRIVIDSLTALISDPTLFGVKKKCTEVFESISRSGCTMILTGDVQSGSRSATYYGIEEQYVSGLILFRSTSVNGDIVRYLCVPKMKGVSHTMQKYVFEINPSGGGILVSETLREYIDTRRRRFVPMNTATPRIGSELIYAGGFPCGSTQPSSYATTFQQTGGKGAKRPAPEELQLTTGGKLVRSTVRLAQVKEIKLTTAAIDNPWVALISERDESNAGAPEVGESAINPQ